MKRRIFIALLLCCIIGRFSAQQDSLQFKKIIINTSVFSYLPDQLNTGTFNLGSEFYLKNRKSLGLNVGLIRSYGPSGGWFTVSSLSTRGFKIQADGKYFFGKRKVIQPLMLIFWPHILQFKTQEVQNAGYYWGAEVFYQNTITNRRERVVEDIEYSGFFPVTHYRDNFYTVNRSEYAGRLKIGYQCIKRSGLVVDFAIGLGAQYISSYSINRIANYTGFAGFQNEWLWPKLFDTGAGLYPSILYQLKLGWAF